MIGQSIRDHREAKGLTQLELAQKLGYESAQFVSLFERGLSKVPLKILGKCFVILNLTKKEQSKIALGIIEDYAADVMEQIESGISETNL